MEAAIDVAALGEIQQFLDGHFTTLDSLELVDDLLRDAEHTQAQLEAEAAEASRTVEALSADASRVADSVRAKALELIDVHSRAVGPAADERTSTWEFRDGTANMELVAALASELHTYRRLSLAKEYVDAVVQVEAAAAQAAQGAAKNPQAVLAAFGSAVALLARHSGSQSVGSSASDCGSGAPLSHHLLDHIRQTTVGIWTGAEQAAAAALGESLQRMRWPGKVDMSSAQALGEFGASFSMLASLDHAAHDALETLRRSDIELRPAAAPPLPLEHMARAVDIRMRFHFESARETSRADKPEWWLSHVLSMVRNLVPLLESHVQDLYDGAALPPLDVRNELIRLVLPIVERKLAHDRPEYLRRGLVVAHVAHELAAFEHTLRDVYFFDGPSVLERFLADAETFAAWIEAERRLAIDSYMEAIAAPDAFELLYEKGVVGEDDPSPTRIAQKAVMLVEDAAERYSVVPSCMQRLQMLSTAQFPVVIALVEDVEAEIDEFSRMSLAFIRDAAAGGDDGARLGGLSPFMAQLRRLSSWYQTVWLVEEAAGDWNNSELYVDMWAAVCRHAAALGSTADPRDWREGCDQWGDADRRVLDGAAGRSAAGDEWLDGGIWERAIGTLGALKQRILELMSRAINKNTVDQLRAYRKKADWASRGADACVDVDVSSELGGLLLGLAQLVAELTDLMPFAGSTYLLRSLAAELDGFLVERVAGAHPFNASGGRQFAMDVGALGRILLSPARPRNQHGPQRRMLPRAAECARILSCSLDGDSVSPSEIPLPLSGWASAVIDPTVDDGEVAQVLTKLGLTCLPLEDVRRLIGRRVDFGATYGGRAQD